MAFASTRIRAQEAVIKSCDLCEEDENVNWFCKDCVQNLCERCKKMHIKTATCINHRIVSILEGVAIQKINVSNLCHKHNEPFLFFCRKCEENICSICLSMVHKKHDFIDLRNLHSELAGSLDKIMKEKQDEQKQITKNIDELENYANQCRYALTKTCETIDGRIKVIHTNVNEEGHKLKETFKTLTDKQIAEGEKRRQKLEERKYNYDETIKTIQQELTLQTAATYNHFVKTSTSKLQSLRRLTCSIPSVCGTQFTAGRTSHDLIVEMIGKIDVQQDVRQSFEVVESEKKGTNIFSKLQLVNIHECENDCYSVCTSPDGSIWIGGEGYVYKMSSDFSSVLQKIPARENDFFGPWTCDNIECLTSGDAVVCYGSCYVDRFTSDGRRVEFRTPSQTYLYDIAVTNNDEVIVSASENMSSSPIISLVMYSKDGSHMNEKTLKKEIRGFCVNNDGNYVVSYKKSSCLTTLDRSGSVLQKRRISKQYLRRMRCDRYGNILGIPRGTNKEVYLISVDGKVKRSFSVKCDDSIDDICVDYDNRLFILVDHKTVIIAKYLE